MMMKVNHCLNVDLDNVKALFDAGYEKNLARDA